MNSFVYYSANSKKTYIDNGKVKMSYMQDGFKEGLKFLNKLSADGLMIEETWTQDASSLKALTSGDTQLVGSVPGGYIPSITTITTNSDDSWAKWIAINPLKGPNGVQYADTSLQLPQTQVNITSQCKYPRIAFRVFNAMYKPEIACSLQNGLQGEYWDVAKDGDIGLDGNKAVYAITKRFEEGTTAELNYRWGLIGVVSPSVGWALGKKVDDPKLDQDAITYNATKGYIPYAAKTDMILPALLFEGDDTKKVLDLENSLNTCFDQNYVDMIVNGDIDNKWTSFQKEIKDLGIDELVELYQKAYDQKMSSLK